MKQKRLEWLKDYINPSIKIGRVKFLAFTLINIALAGLILLGAHLGMHFIAIYVGVQLVSLSTTNLTIKRIFSIGFVRSVVAIFTFTVLLFILAMVIKSNSVVSVIISGYIIIILLGLFVFPAKKINPEEDALEKVKVSYKEAFKFIFLNKDGVINRRTYFATGCLMLQLAYFVGFIVMLSAFAVGINLIDNSLGMSAFYAFIVLTSCYFVYCYTLKRVNSFNGKKVLAIMLAFVFPILTLLLNFTYTYSLQNMEIGFLQLSLYVLMAVYVINIIIGLYVLFKKSKYELTAENFAIYNKIKHLVLVLFLVSNLILITVGSLATSIIPHF